MKKIIQKIYLVGLIVICTACSSIVTPNQPQTSIAQEYQQAVEKFTPITIEQLKEKMKTESNFLIYMGRSTCEHCQVFVPKLRDAVQKTGVTIYYLDVQNANDQAKEFFKNYNIQTVPNLSYFKGNQKIATLTKGSDASISEIELFLNEHH